MPDRRAPQVWRQVSPRRVLLRAGRSVSARLVQLVSAQRAEALRVVQLEAMAPVDRRAELHFARPARRADRFARAPLACRLSRLSAQPPWSPHSEWMAAARTFRSLAPR